MPKPQNRQTGYLEGAIDDTIAAGGLISELPHKPKGRGGRIMYIECKAGGLVGTARIGRVTFNKTGKTIYYKDQVFRRIVGGGFKSNYFDEASRADYWISGPKRRGGDRMYGSSLPVDIDEDARVEYWRDIRSQPERIAEKTA